MPRQEYIQEVIEYIKKEKPSKEKLTQIKNRLCKKHKLDKPPTDIEISLHADRRDIDELKPFLLTKPMRTQSGVSVIALMTAPFGCPHGTCTMCPAMTSKGIPMSYTGKEPSTRRGLRNAFDPYLGIWNRLEQYIVSGHNFDKVEIIIMGGTFPATPKEYREDFILQIFRAQNDFSRMFFKDVEFLHEKFMGFFELPGNLDDFERNARVQEKILEHKKKNNETLKDAQSYNDLFSQIRCVGMTVETRADWGMLPHGNDFLRWGVTRVEIGVQSVYDDVLNKIKRGNKVKDNIDSIRILKDLGFKINIHYMPGLPGVGSYERDLEGMKRLFLSEDYRPDMLKIYPTMVMKDSELYDDWKNGKFTPIRTEDAARMIAEFKKVVPHYCRIMRVQRDIPTYMTEDGVDRTNLRQYVAEKTRELGIKCKCIRCREPMGHKISEKIVYKVLEYRASEGREFFISAEDSENGFLLGFSRLRLPSSCLRSEIDEGTAILRELHVYGTAARIGEEGFHVQHRGIGATLMHIAEHMALMSGKSKIAVISGVGVRDYYRKKLGYELEGQYMVKRIGAV